MRRTLAHAKESEPFMPTHFAILYYHGPAYRPGEPLADHARYLQKLTDGGVLVMAGPFADNSAALCILKTSALATARAIADADPAVVSHAFTA